MDKASFRLVIFVLQSTLEPHGLWLVLYLLFCLIKIFVAPKLPVFILKEKFIFFINHIVSLKGPVVFIKCFVDLSINSVLKILSHLTHRFTNEI